MTVQDPGSAEVPPWQGIAWQALREVLTADIMDTAGTITEGGQGQAARAVLTGRLGTLLEVLEKMDALEGGKT